MKSGINFPWIQYNYLINNQNIIYKEYKNNIYYVDEFKDLQVNVKKILSGKQNLFSFLKPYFSEHIFAIWSIIDIKPFTRHILDGFKVLFSTKKLRTSK